MSDDGVDEFAERIQDKSTPAQAIAEPSERPSTSSKPPKEQTLHLSDSLLAFLVLFRTWNASMVRTFFQPDEYFQCLEPAWSLAFGEGSAAWITWEWRNQLRSAFHPALFSLPYMLVDLVATALNYSPSSKADLLLSAPKALQAVIAALSDYYSIKLAQQIYGRDSRHSHAVLALTLVSPWQWFVSTRTFSNSLETTLTVYALYNWPWHCGVTQNGVEAAVDVQALRVRTVESTDNNVDEITRLRRALLFASLATVLRPTNALIWFVLTLHTFVPFWDSDLWGFTSVTTALTRTEFIVFARELLLCGSSVLGLTAIIDRMFYKTWTFPAAHFLYFNVIQSLAVFYGNNDWHYYLSQGYPLLLTTALPFGIYGINYGLRIASGDPKLPPQSGGALNGLALISIIVPAFLSILAHKEMRFIYPILPALHILAAQPLVQFFGPAFHRANHHKLVPPYRLVKRVLLVTILCLNFGIASYISTVHNSGLIDLTHYFRHEFETHYLDSYPPTNLTVGMLMPCHSTPWRSHLQYPPSTTTPGIDGWALTCEPPLNLNATQKQTYLDEADQFYADPSQWLKRHMSRRTPKTQQPGVFTASARPRRMWEVETTSDTSYRERTGRKPWPDYLVFFEQLEPTMQSLMRDSGYDQCHRLFNSDWHDDWRRTGDIVVWCLYPERRTSLARDPSGRRWLEKALKVLGFGKTEQEILSEVEDHIHDPVGHHEPITGAGGQKILESRDIRSGKADKVTEKREMRGRAGPQRKADSAVVPGKRFWKASEPALVPQGGSGWWDRTLQRFGLRDKRINNKKGKGNKLWT